MSSRIPQSLLRPAFGYIRQARWLPSPVSIPRSTICRPLSATAKMRGSGRGAYFKAKYGRPSNRDGVDQGSSTGNFQQNAHNSERWTTHREPGEMETVDDLQRELQRIDRKQYGAYKDLRGRTFAYKRYGHGEASFTLQIDHVQSDTYAPPSNVRVTLPVTELKWDVLTREFCSNVDNQVPLSDFISRQLHSLRGNAPPPPSTRSFHAPKGSSSDISIYALRQNILPNSSVCMTDSAGHWAFEVRFNLVLPAAGRTILGRQATEILVKEVENWFDDLLATFEREQATKHIQAYHDANALRAQLAPKNLVAFVANGSILARKSGVDDKPMSVEEGAVPFTSPPGLEVTLDTPFSGPVKGMGIPAGVTVLTGGGFHGKSTLLNAIQAGIYNHVFGDGREKVVTDATAFKLRAEDGRFVNTVDISALISNLPGGRTTTAFSTDDASGSTSMAASLIEAVQLGSKTLLLDEDTCATNLLIRDARMHALVESECITPLVEKIGGLYRQHGVSTIIVCGGSGDYLDVAHTVIGAKEYKYYDWTSRAREIVQAIPARVQQKPEFSVRDRRVYITARFEEERSAQYFSPSGMIDMALVEQVIDPGQLRYIHRVLQRMYNQPATDLSTGILNALKGSRGALLGGEGFVRGDVVWCREIEVGAAVNRCREGVVARCLGK